MVGSPLTGTSQGQRLQGDASLTYSLTSQTLNAAFTNIRNLDTETAHSVPSVNFTGVPVDGQGKFEDGPGAGPPAKPGSTAPSTVPHGETAGVFRSSNIVRAFGAKQQ